MNLLRAVTLGSRRGAYGGPYDTALRQSTLASARGFAVRLIAGSFRGDAPSVRPEGPVVDAEFPVVKRWIPLPAFTAVFSIGWLRRMVQSLRWADVLHLSIAREAIPIVTLALAETMHVRTVLQPHGMLTSRTSRLHRVIDVFLRPLVRRASVLIALTQREATALADWLGPATGPPILVIGNPVPDVERAHLPSESRSPTEVLAVSRLHPRKRIDVFVDAAEEAGRREWDENYRLVGPDEGEAARLNLRQNGAERAVVWEGPVPESEVQGRLSRASVFVLCSQAEPWGNVLMLAIAMGKPVVVTASAAMASEVERLGCGIVVDDGDAIGLAEAVHRVVSQSGLYARLAARTAAFQALHLDQAAVQERLVEAYEGR